MAAQIKKPEVKSQELVKVVARGCNLYDPIDNVWYKDGQVVSVEKITSWLKLQMDAGLVRRI